MRNIEYYLMNKDKKVAKLNISGNKITIDTVYEYIPPYLYDVDAWLTSRSNPAGRENIRSLLKYAQINTEEEFLFVDKAIALTDTFWVNNNKSSMTWRQVNPFTNRFSQIMSNIALNCEYNGRNCNFRSPTPEYTLDGSANKCWKRENGNIYLYKTSGIKNKYSGLYGIRPYCEYYASQVASALNLKSVTYGIRVKEIDKDNVQPYVYCKIFTSEKYGYVPIGNTKYSRENNIVDLMEILMNTSKVDAMKLAEMLLLDAIILNGDRHQGNYGFLYNNDSETYDIVGLAPIFDNDLSLGAISAVRKDLRESYEDAYSRMPQTGEFEYTEQGVFALRQMHRVKDKTGMSYGQYMINKMKSIYPFKFTHIRDKNLDLPDDRINFMGFIVNTQIASILQALNINI